MRDDCPLTTGNHAVKGRCAQPCGENAENAGHLCRKGSDCCKISVLEGAYEECRIRGDDSVLQ
jgi:hypothetical protein